MDVIISNKSGRKCITIISPASNQPMLTNSKGPDHETTALSTIDQDETTAAAAPRVTVTAPHDIITTVVNNILSNHHSSPIANSVSNVDNSVVSIADNSNDTADNSVPSGNVPATAAESSKVKKAGASNVDFSVALSELMDKVRENCFYIYTVHCNENPIYVFLFWELRGLSPNFHIHVSASDLYITWIGPHISSSKIGRSIEVTLNR
jgi:hypothetical protein